MNFRPFPGITAAILLLAAATTASQANAAPNLILNGSFEANAFSGPYILPTPGAPDIPGWQIVGGSDVAVHKVPDQAIAKNNPAFGPAQDGAYYLDLSGALDAPHAAVQQDVVTTPGFTYELSFYSGSSNPAVAPTINYQVGDATNPHAFTVQPLPPSGVIQWRRESFTFLATSNITRVRFVDTSTFNDEGSYVDNVALVQTAVPTDNIQAIRLLSPPTGITIAQGQPTNIYAEVDALPGMFGSIEFYYNDGAGDVLIGTSTVSRDSRPWTPPHAGVFMLKLKVFDTAGASKLATYSPITVTAAPAGANGIGPTVKLLGGLDHRQFDLGTMVPVAVDARDADGNPLSSVQFYVDDQPYGSPVVLKNHPGHTGPVTRDIASKENFANILIALTKEVQLITAVGQDKNGVSATSRGAQIFAKTAPLKLTCDIVAPASGSTVRMGATASVFTSEPNGSVQKVEFYVNDTKIGESATAPFDFVLTAPQSGTYMLTAVATDVAGFNKVSDPVSVNLAAVPMVTVAPLNDDSVSEAGGKIKVAFTRDGDVSGSLTVYFRWKGTAQNGVDYQPLDDSLVIPAGKSVKKVVIRPIDDSTANGNRTVIAKLLASPDGDYNMGAPKKAVMTILDND
jgi:hypothetical protein